MTIRLLFALLFLALTGCAQFAAVDAALDTARERYCTNPVARASVSANLAVRASQEDYAICLRCPGEEQLSCVGNPGEL